MLRLMDISYAAVLIVLGVMLFLCAPLYDILTQLYVSTRNTKIYAAIMFFSGVFIFLGTKYHFSTDIVGIVVIVVLMWSIFKSVPAGKLPGTDRYTVYKGTAFSRWAKKQNILVRLILGVTVTLIIGIIFYYLSLLVASILSELL